MYISQDEVFSDFNDTQSLFWFHRDLVYGDWNTGEEGDGCYEHSIDLDIPEVRGDWVGEGEGKVGCPFSNRSLFFADPMCYRRCK